MPKYNIIFTSPNNDPYIWNGTTLDKLKNHDQEVLFFSGKSFKEDGLKDAINQAKEAARKKFPGSDDPEIKTVEIGVSD